MAMPRWVPSTRISSPPPGSRFSCERIMSSAAATRARPIPSWTPRRAYPDTTPAPRYEPTTAEAIMRTRVTGSTGTLRV